MQCYACFDNDIMTRVKITSSAFIKKIKTRIFLKQFNGFVPIFFPTFKAEQVRIFWRGGDFQKIFEILSVFSP